MPTPCSGRAQIIIALYDCTSYIKLPGRALIATLTCAVLYMPTQPVSTAESALSLGSQLANAADFVDGISRCTKT